LGTEYKRDKKAKNAKTDNDNDIQALTDEIFGKANEKKR
jgi:hypothetical protein